MTSDIGSKIITLTLQEYVKDMIEARRQGYELAQEILDVAWHKESNELLYKEFIEFYSKKYLKKEK